MCILYATSQLSLFFSWWFLISIPLKFTIEHFHSSFNLSVYKEPLFNDLLRLFHRKKHHKDIKIDLPKLLRPHGEKYTHLNEGIYKKTEKFYGEKNFWIPFTKPPHIFFIAIESFQRKHHLGHSITPKFDALCREGFYFDQFYSNGCNSHAAYLSSVTGTHPLIGDYSRNTGPKGFSVLPTLLHPSLKQQDITTAITLDSIHPISIETVLKEKGYQCNAHSGYINRDSEAVSYFKNCKFAVNQFSALPSKQSSWGIDDADLYHEVLKKIETDKPQFHMIVTSSSHHPFYTESPWDKLYLECENNQSKAYMQSIRYADACLDTFITKLKQSSIANNALICIFGDHGFALDTHENKGLWDALTQQHIHIPLLILSPSRINKPKTFSFASSHVDLLPTVMDLLSVHQPNHALGSSLCRKSTNKSAIITQMTKDFGIGIIKDHTKWVFDQKGNKLQFNLKKDPLEKTNIYQPKPENLSLEHDLFESILFCRNKLYTDSLTKQSSPSHLAMQEFSACKNLLFRDRDLKTLPGDPELLLRLDLSSTLVSDAGITALCTYYKNLNFILINHCPLITSTSIKKLISTFSIQHLEIDGIRDPHIATILFPLPKNLSYLCMDSVPIENKHLKLLGENTSSLRCFSFDASSITPEGIYYLASLNHIHCLMVNNLHTLDNSWIEALSSLSLSMLLFSKIHESNDCSLLNSFPTPALSFSECNITDDVIQNLNASSLMHLQINQCPLLTIKSQQRINQLPLSDQIVTNCSF